MSEAEIPRVFGLDVGSVDSATAQDVLQTAEKILQSSTSEQSKADALMTLGINSQFSRFERGLDSRRFFLIEEILRRYAALREQHPARETLRAARTISMLHEEALMLCHLFGAACDITVEVGPYIGGSTLAIARGVQRGGRSPAISIEKGGEYVHATLSSRDIVGDLKANLANAGLTDYVHVVVGHMRTEETIAEVTRLLNGREINFLFIDSDGEVEMDWPIFQPLLSYGAIVAFDDYESLDAGAKTAMIKPFADKLAADGVLRPLGVFGWGTWFAQNMVLRGDVQE